MSRRDRQTDATRRAMQSRRQGRPWGSHRKIIHVDMDAFYAAVEQRDDPSLKGKPVVVGGLSDRGVVSAASYEARRFGIRSAMPMRTARKLCPHAILLTPRMARYRAVSEQIHQIFEEHTDLIESIALDESFLDVTRDKKRIEDPREIARQIRAAIGERTGLTASAGVGPNKFVAKIASDLRKPDALVVVHPAEVRDFLADLPVSRIWGVGKVTEKKLNAMGVRTIEQLARLTPERLAQRFGKLGPYFLKLARGEDHRPVVSVRLPKSISQETTFEHDVADRAVLEKVCRELCRAVSRRLGREQFRARCVTLKLRYPDFTTLTRRRTVAEPLETAEELASVALGLIDRFDLRGKAVRLLGVGASDLVPRETRLAVQLSLFPPALRARENSAHPDGAGVDRG